MKEQDTEQDVKLTLLTYELRGPVLFKCLCYTCETLSIYNHCYQFVILQGDGIVSGSSHFLLLFLFEDRKKVFQGSFEMKILGVVLQRFFFFQVKIL